MRERTRDVLTVVAFVVTLGLAFGAGAFLALISPLPEPVLENGLTCPDYVNNRDDASKGFCNRMPMHRNAGFVLMV